MSEPRIPEGDYEARACKGEFGYTSKGNEQVVVEFELLHPDFDGERITWFGYFTEKTSARTLESLRYMGWASDDVTDLSTIGANHVQLVIKHEVYEGKKRARVAWVNRLGGGGVQLKTPMDDAKKKAFAQRMKAAAIKSRDTAKPNPQPQIEPSDDVGF